MRPKSKLSLFFADLAIIAGTLIIALTVSVAISKWAPSIPGLDGEILSLAVFYGLLVCPLFLYWQAAAGKSVPGDQTSIKPAGLERDGIWAAISFAGMFSVFLACSQQFHFWDFPATPRVDYAIEALLKGGPSHWNDQLWMGVPGPLQINHSLHPIAFISYAMTGKVNEGLLLSFHASLAVVFVYLLARRLGAGNGLAACAALTYSLSEGSLHYMLLARGYGSYQGLVWYMAPVLLYLLDKFIEAPKGRSEWPSGLSFVVLYGFTFTNGHVGHTLLLTIMFATYTLAHPSLQIRKLGLLTLGSIFFLAIGSWKVIYLLNEIGSFPDGLRNRQWGNIPQPSIDAPFQLTYWKAFLWDMFARPAFRPSLTELAEAASIASATKALWQQFQEHNSGIKLIFFGTPFVFAAFCGLRTGIPGARQRLHMIVPFAIGLIGMVTPPNITFGVVAYAFAWNEVASLAGILLAVSVLAKTQQNAGGSRFLAERTVALQAFVMIVAASAGITKHINTPYLASWEVELEKVEWVKELAAALPPPPADLHPRVYPSPRASALLRLDYSYDPLIKHGFSLITSVGINAVSADPISPAIAKMEAAVPPLQDTLENRPLLDLIAARYLVVADDETLPPPAREIANISLGVSHAIRVYENPNAWPDAMVFSQAVNGLSTRVRPGCEHNRLLCREVSQVVELARTEDVHDTLWDGDRLVLKLRARAEASVAVLSQMYRPDWQVFADGKPVSVFAFLDSLVGAEIPAGTKEVIFEYRPTRMVVASRITLITLAVGAVLLAWSCFEALRKNRSI